VIKLLKSACRSTRLEREEREKNHEGKRHARRDDPFRSLYVAPLVAPIGLDLGPRVRHPDVLSMAGSPCGNGKRHSGGFTA
jgi:hypothetical protein